MMPRSLLVSCSAALVFLSTFGCSSSSSSPPQRIDTGSLALAVTPDDHDDVAGFRATFERVELIDANGQSTGNLLAADTRAWVIAEDTDPVFVELKAPPEGRYTQCVVTYRAAGQEARLRDGTPVTLEATEVVQNMPIGGGGLQQRAATRSWLTLRHTRDVDAWTDAGRWKWRPRQECDAEPGAFFHDSRVRVQSILSVSEFRFLGAFDSGGAPLSAEFVVDENAIVIAEATGPITRQDLFARLRADMVVKVLGSLGVDGAVHVRHLVLRQATPADDEVEVLARFTALDRPAAAGEVSILAAREGRDRVDAFLAGNPDRRIPLALTGARIRSVGGSTDLTIADLATGQRVVLTFPHFPVGGAMPVTSVDLADDQFEFDGRVTDTAGLPTNFGVTARTDDLMFRCGCIDPSVRVNLGPGTRLFRTARNQPATVAELLPGTRVRVRGTLVSSAIVTASSVRLREPTNQGQ